MIRVIRLFRRQLSLPVVGNDLVLSEFQDWLQENCTESDFTLIDPHSLNEKYEAAIKALSARMPFEDHLLSHAYEVSSVTNKVGTWKAYIKFEMQEEALQRTQRLYERAVVACPSSLELWLDFVDFALNQLKSWALVDSITARVTRVFPSDYSLWKLRLHALEILKKQTDEITSSATTVFFYFRIIIAIFN